MYDGFFNDRDRRLCEQVRSTSPLSTGAALPFDDPRLPELHFRYRARNFPECLSATEAEQWHAFCRQRLMKPEFGAPNTSEQFEKAVQVLLPSTTPEQACLLQQWLIHVRGLRERYMF